MKWFLLATLSLLMTACASDETSSGFEVFADDRGRWVLVNYWAQWCKPCIEEIPELNAVDANHANITVYGVNYEGATGEALAAQEAQLGIAFPTLAEDPSFALGIRKPAVLPTTLVINPEGELVRTLLGPQTQESLVAAATAPEPVSDTPVN